MSGDATTPRTRDAAPRAAPVPSRPTASWPSGLERYYGKWRVVNDVTVDVRRGEVVGLLGPNGAGKTTSFYMIVGLLRPSRGRILLDGRDITDEPVYRRARLGLGYLAQEPSIFRRLTVRENVLAVLETMPLTPRRARARGSSSCSTSSTSRTSPTARPQALGRRAPARRDHAGAGARSRRFMLLDEPFVGIDPIAVAEIQDIVGAPARSRPRAC